MVFAWCICLLQDDGYRSKKLIQVWIELEGNKFSTNLSIVLEAKFGVQSGMLGFNFNLVDKNSSRSLVAHFRKSQPE